MGIAYRLMYLLGFTPWDRILPRDLVGAIEGPGALPRGRALDLGSGHGGKAIYMAQHGWLVTGVEMVPAALREAQRSAKIAGVEVDFRRGDVTRLGELGLAPGYSLLFDFGCFHGLNAEQRSRYVEGVTPLAAHGATLLMMAFTRSLPPLIAGATESELRDRFGGGWELQWSRSNQEGGTRAMARASSAVFCLTRR